MDTKCFLMFVINNDHCKVQWGSNEVKQYDAVQYMSSILNYSVIYENSSYSSYTCSLSSEETCLLSAPECVSSSPLPSNAETGAENRCF